MPTLCENVFKRIFTLNIIANKDNQLRIIYITQITILVAIFSSCDSVRFPGEVDSEVTENHFRMKDTKLFVVTPPEYEYLQGANLFKGKDSTFIYCMTLPSNFYSVIQTRDFDFFFNQTYDIISQQEFTINNLPGIFYELEENDIRYFYFYYGDSLIENRILGVLSNGSKQRKNIFDFVASSYYDSNMIIDPMENAKFRIYPSIIGFNYETSMMNQYVYFEEEHQKYSDRGEQFNSISISQLPRSSSKNDIDATFDIMVSQIVNQGLNVTEVLFNDTLTVDDSYAKAIAFEAEYDNSLRIVYILTTGKDNTIVNVAGNFHHNGMELVPKIHALASEMRITGGNNNHE